MTGDGDASAAAAISTETASLSDLDSDGRATLFAGEPHTVLLSLEAGESVPAHQHPERVIVLHLLAGELELTLGEETHDLSPGEVIRFDGRQDISPAAVEDSEALLVLAPRPD